MTSGAISKGNEIFVLDMGKPVKITTLAENIIKMYGYEPYTEIKIEFVGLRPGEKLYEELLMDEEGLKSTVNHKIFIGNQHHIDSERFFKDLEDLQVAAEDNNQRDALKLLKKIVPTFRCHIEVEAEENKKVIGGVFHE